MDKLRHSEMTLHYHGTPITPRHVLLSLPGRLFCISHAAPQDVEVCHEIGQGSMLDNGAFSKWRSGKATDWAKFYEWCDRWLSFSSTWAVIPDVIDGTLEEQAALIAQWPFGFRGAPVWHLNEPISRLLALCDAWPRVCVGSTKIYDPVGSPRWRARMDDACSQLAQRHRHFPWLHMLRGMRTVKPIFDYPFGSVDSTDVARNHAQAVWAPSAKVHMWDSMQCPGNADGPMERMLFRTAEDAA